MAPPNCSNGPYCDVTNRVSLEVDGVGRTVSGDVNDHGIRLGIRKVCNEARESLEFSTLTINEKPLLALTLRLQPNRNPTMHYLSNVRVALSRIGTLGRRPWPRQPCSSGPFEQTFSRGP